jgi:succinate dehydrogenase / fumarate reductase cytochrome b subunit
MATEGSSRPAANRPLSPHLQIYKWQWTMTLSILHRITGIVLTVGTLLLVYWLVAAAAGPAEFAQAQALIDHWIGRLLLFGWSLALFYHLFSGIRHLVWDTGRGFELRTAATSGYIVVLLSLVVTALVWLYGYGLI